MTRCVGAGDTKNGNSVDAHDVDQLPGVMRRDRVPRGVGVKTTVLVEENSLCPFEDRHPKIGYGCVDDQPVGQCLVQITGDSLSVHFPEVELAECIDMDPVDKLLQFDQGSLALKFQ